MKNSRVPADTGGVSHTLGGLKEPGRKPRLAGIPAFPPIVLRLLNLLASDDVEIRDLVALVSSDPAFAAQILRVANSPLFGFRSQIDSLQSALVILGLQRVRALTMTVATSNHMKAALKIEELSLCWRHMLACAVITEELARSCSAFEDRAYSAGLLHDVGRLGLLLAHPEEYARMLRDADHNAWDLLECEKQSFGMDHCEAGRVLAAQWNLPPDFAIVAARHHDSQEDFQLDLLTLVHLGCKLADSLGFWVVKPLQPRTPEEIQAALPPQLKQRIHIDEARWRELLARRVQAFASADALTLSEERPPSSEPEAQDEPELQLELPANGHSADRQEQKPSGESQEQLTIVMLFIFVVVLVVFFVITR